MRYAGVFHTVEFSVLLYKYGGGKTPAGGDIRSAAIAGKKKQ
jgi:hypothetical protein